MGRAWYTMTFLVAIIMVTWDEVKRGKRIPNPRRYISVGLVWAVLGIVAELGAPEIAAAFGVGLLIALAYRMYQVPAAPTNPETGQQSSGAGEGQSTGQSKGVLV